MYDNFYIITFIWILFWQGILTIPPGPREIKSTLRLHFLNGIISSILSSLCLLGIIPEVLAISCVFGYMITDLINMLLNDFIFKVKSYHSPSARKIEYFHHSLCAIVCSVSNTYNTYCTVNMNPIITIMLAEISTPFLIAWRWTNQENIILGILFFISFIPLRTIYQCMFYMPYLFNSCNNIVGFGLIIPYILLQLFLTYQLLIKAKKILTIK
jgi:hypothetical protein